MNDKPTHQDRLKGILHQEPSAPHPKAEAESDEAESPGAAFGYLRGIRDLPGQLAGGGGALRGK